MFQPVGTADSTRPRVTRGLAKTATRTLRLIKLERLPVHLTLAPPPPTADQGSAKTNWRPTPMERKSLRPAEAAQLLGVCRDTIYVLMRAGRLRSVKVGRARLIPVRAIEELLAQEELAA